MLFIISSPFPSLGLVLLSSIPRFPVNVLRACLQGPKEIGLQVKEKGGPAVPPPRPLWLRLQDPPLQPGTPHLLFVEATAKAGAAVTQSVTQSPGCLVVNLITYHL